MKLNELYMKDGLYYNKYTDNLFSGHIDEGEKIGTFKNGLKHGWVINYSQNKEIIHKELYKNGEVLKGKARVAYLTECEIKGIDPNEQIS